MIKIALAAAATLTLGTVPALAKDGSWPVGNDQVHLIYSNIDMGTAAGRAMMLSHVERAARKLCRDRVLSSYERECVRSIIADAAAQNGNRGLALALSEREGTAFVER